MENIFFGAEAFPKLQEFLQNKAFSQVLVLADENTRRDCYPLVKKFLPEHQILQITSGEANKTLQTCETIWQFLTEKQFDRWSVVVNLGGGVIGDMGGFCAALYKRGITFVNVPTTLLAMVDASVGGKTGVDFSGFKNQLGIFQQPTSVFIDPVFLETLSGRQLKSGYAEMIKHWLIADAAAFETQRWNGLLAADWQELIPEAVKIKSRIVQADPLENGLRKVLNFGHTVGHAAESYFLQQPGRELLHGEAIAVGLLCESYLSEQKGLLSNSELSKIETFLASVFEKVKLTPEDIAGILPFLQQDKKNFRGTINCVLLESIGKPVYDQPVTLAEVEKSLRYYQLI
ncbi:3-dehydroquinate synthase [Adhaeribacter sp. BT258]|uniref:3-dehydroquinate synthase n=1 Tax=Adhaeribacter terrigena TaxID=2793070 RepID=A0ABS1BXA4_9BACT|nr:3-dehydroquinate synthase [Adhaeribacter terrigena]MBK0401785.1 3-dehydroquinate synthase [Adhaeribacter terrigena]